jgi:hypothetical protein
MERFVFQFWWLVFPLAWFVVGSIGQVLAYFRGRDAMRALKSYADQGREPPAELLRAVQGEPPLDAHDHGWRARRSCAWGPYAVWSRVITCGALSAGLAYAASVDLVPAWREGFQIAAVVTGAIAVGSLLLAFLAPPLQRRA